MLANFRRIASALTICAMIFGCSREPLPLETTLVPTQLFQPTAIARTPEPPTPEPTPAPTPAPTLSIPIGQVPDWIKAYYERYDGISITSGGVILIDLNFDGVPELLQSYFGTRYTSYSGAFTVIDGESVEIPDIRWKGMRSNLSDYHSLWLVVDNGVRKWLSVSENFDSRGNTGYFHIDLTDCSELPEIESEGLVYSSLLDPDALPALDADGNFIHGPVLRVNGEYIDLSDDEKAEMALWLTGKSKVQPGLIPAYDSVIASFDDCLYFKYVVVPLNDGPSGRWFYAEQPFEVFAAKMMAWYDE
ncbi:MAG: hypothetical protein LBK41_01550 [Clostridiales bacterium]|jgi:hypothetical protein|nr:hypothetical protein [Clostridiales bacterium]